MNKKPIKKTNPLEKLALFLVLLVAINLGIIVLLQTQAKTIVLLKDQLRQLEKDQQIVASSEEIYATYEQDIDRILNVFPNEETVLDFLQTLERLTKEVSVDSTIRFASLNPMPETDKLFLLFNISLRTNRELFDIFLERLETLPYMTRIISTQVNFADGDVNNVDAMIVLKLYVQNPFTTK